MDEIQIISKDQIEEIVVKHKFNFNLILKDYYVTLVLYSLKDIKGIYFKGGTALQKIFLDYSRISEDIDYTLTRDLNEVKADIVDVLGKSQIFQKITKDKDVEGFTRLIIHYKDFDGRDQTVFVDLNQRAKLLLPPETHEIKHFYDGFIPKFSVSTLAKDEMVAEKMAATIVRNKPRDHYDLYKIIKAGLHINTELVKKKCEQAGVEFSIVRMFCQANKLKNRWDEDLAPLLSEEITFYDVMQTLARHFRLKEEKERLKKQSSKDT